MIAKEHVLACLCTLGRKTITNFAIFLGRDEKSFVTDDKLSSEYKWNANKIFDPLLKEGLSLIKDLSSTKGNYITIAVDDTTIKKTGKKIPQACRYRDAMGPKFHVNLI